MLVLHIVKLAFLLILFLQIGHLFFSLFGISTPLKVMKDVLNYSHNFLICIILVGTSNDYHMSLLGYHHSLPYFFLSLRIRIFMASNSVFGSFPLG